MKRATLIASATLMFALGSSAALAQPGGPQPLDSGADYPWLPDDPRRQEDRAAAQDPFRLHRPRDAQARPAALSEISAGGVVRDRNMAFLGTIESVARSTAVVRHGRGQTAVVPLSAFWNLNGNIALAVSRGDFGRIASAARPRSEETTEAEDDQAE